MRIPGILLLLLSLVVTLAYPHVDQRLPADASAVATYKSSTADEHHWRYSKQSPFHDFLESNVQQFSSTDPQETAERVCNEFGGEVGHISMANEPEMTVAFLCRFTEPDVTMSVDFGELHRIPAR